MKILQINKFFYVRGGASRYFFEVSDLLKSFGHEIAFFSMDDPKNQGSEWSKYFVGDISYERVEMKAALRKVLNMIYSFEARKKISQLLDNFHPDIAHLHSIYHHLSPSIIYELVKRKIPIVQTLHDYHLISPNHTLFHDGKICEITKQRKSYKAILHKCVKGSTLAGIIEAIEQYIHLFLGINNKVNIFISPSKFHAKKLLEYGIPKEKIDVLHNFCDYRKFKPHYELGKYILYFGRLSPEKGINYLIDAMKLIPKIKLKIVGQGNSKYEKKLKAQAKDLTNIKFIGFKDGYELKEIISNSRFTVLPSVWYEVFGLSILESFASGKPIIASNIGGIPETVKDGFNGFLVKPGDFQDLAEKIKKLWNNPAMCRKLGRNARDFVENNFRSEEHYEKLMGIYKRAINKHK